MCNAAVANGVSVGAQVGYPDLVGFGRRAIDIDPLELRDAVLYQLGALDAFAQVAGAEVAYVKPHGALYHATFATPRRPRPSSPRPPTTTPRSPCSAPRTRAAAGRRGGRPRTGSRGVRRPGVPARRSSGVAGASPDALIVEPAEVAARAVRLAVEHEVVSVDGSIVAVDARSLCVHGDTPGAVELARAVRDALEAAGVTVQPFT